MQSDELAERVEGWRENEPWWWPVETDSDWAMEKRKQYPDKAHLTEDALRNHFADGCKYQTLWDHVGDAREEHERLADAFLALLSVLDDVAEGLAGLHPNDDGWEALLFNVEHIGRIDEDVARTLDAVRDLGLRREGEENG